MYACKYPIFTSWQPSAHVGTKIYKFEKIKQKNVHNCQKCVHRFAPINSSQLQDEYIKPRKSKFFRFSRCRDNCHRDNWQPWWVSGSFDSWLFSWSSTLLGAQQVSSFYINHLHEFHETCHSVTFYFMKKDYKRCCDTTMPESIHTKDESKRGSAFAFIFGVNWPEQWM